MMTLLLMVVLGMVGGMVQGSTVPPLNCLTTPQQTTSRISLTDSISNINDFGFELYKELAPPQLPKNFFFSPYSIWSAFTLAYFGTKGRTQQQLEKVLRLQDKRSTMALWLQLEDMYTNRAANATQYTFNLANRAYFQHDLELQPCISVDFQNYIRKVDFSDKNGSAAIINEFVSNTTKGRITSIVEPEHLIDALFVLVNAVFFKGSWLYQFNDTKTKSTNFYPIPSQSVLVPMMNLESTFKYGESQGLQAYILELPYSGNEVSMLLLLPLEEGPQGFANMVNRLNSRTIRQAMEGDFLFRNVQLQLPKFKMEHKLEKDLIEAMAALGTPDIFTRGLANLTDFTELYPGAIHASDVIHKAFVEVSEEGTEAAAATAIVFSTRSSASRAPPPVVFHCNRPFIFLIQDNSKNILFLGAYVDPSL